jgi:hypothetical protein
MLKWTKDLEKIEIVKGTFGEIGATMHLHYNQNGRKSVLEDRLEYLDPYKKIKSRVTGGGFIAGVETTFTSINKETEMTMKWNGKGDNIVVTTFLTILKKKIKRGALSEINLFKELVEKYGVKFN